MNVTLLLGLLLSHPAAAATPTLQEVIGADLSTAKVRGIYRYTCDRTFLEGEGVSVLGGEVTVECRANQRLGLITAPYSFYLYDSKTATNDQSASIMDEKFKGSVFPGSICLKNLEKNSCVSAPALRYGLYGERAGIFQVGVALATKPEATREEDVTSQTMGYAAMLSPQGTCPKGLVKARVWLASPSSITDGMLGNNPPSSFINHNNGLDEKLVEAERPLPFKVKRRANLVPCQSTSTNPNRPTGSCADVAFRNARTVQSSVYAATSPVVCVIPTELLEGAIP
jgi:hypothetical protein